MTIGENIKRERKQKGLTQEELAKKLGVSVMTVRRFETDAREPKMNMIKKIAAVLNIDYIFLIRTSLNPQIITETSEGIEIKEMSKKEAEQLLEQLPQNQLLEAFQSLNEDGQNKVIEYANDITPKYKK